ncbi:F-box/kelch-repeat protein OR23 [Linum grandiflorum]
MTRFRSTPPAFTIPPINSAGSLIPGLPNDVAAQILSMLPYSHHSRVKRTCKSWHLFLSSKTLISLRRHLRHLSHLLCIFPEDPSISSPYLFDPRRLVWRPLPPMPCNPYEYGLCNFTSIFFDHHLYVLGGSLFDTRSFPMDRPTPSSATFRFDLLTSTWERLSPMLSPRGSFACVAIPSLGQIVVAGGGSRHAVFAAAGSRMSSVERYDVARDEWVALDGLPRYRAGCVGFLAGGDHGEEKNFWVMGGYGESRTISGVFPVDEYYKDAVVMEVNQYGTETWKEVGDMWQEGERVRLGKVVAIEEDDDGSSPAVFMLDNNDIFRYDMTLNRWDKEASVPRKAPGESAYGFVALDGELHVMTAVKCSDLSRATRQQQRAGFLLVQIYSPRKKTWRSLLSKPPLESPLDFNTAVMCSIQV